MSDIEYVSIDRDELKRLQADSEELANLLAAQQQAEPVMQVSPEVSKQISKRGRDAIMAAERLVTLDESKTVSLEDMESRFGVEPATHSEEGREPIPDCCQGENCGTRTADHSPECISETERDIQEWVKSSQSSGYSVQPIMWLNGETLDYELSHEPWMDESTDWMALMTVAQHERILKAKEAEIARLNAGLKVEAEDKHEALAELRELRAQPARQVGGGEWPRLEKPATVGNTTFRKGVSSRLVVERAYAQHEYNQQPEIEAERVEKLRAALAPAASKVNSGCYVQDVPEHCDRITWRGHYYGLPPLAPVARQVGGDEREQFEADWRYSRRSDEGEPGNNPARSKTEGKTYAGSAAEYAWIWWQRGRAALAPAAVVMPDRKDVTLATQDDDWPEVVSRRMAQAHNAALDEVARLNRRAIPAGLLERICKDYTGRENWDALEPDRLAAAAELRALLGKS